VRILWLVLRPLEFGEVGLVYVLDVCLMWWWDFPACEVPERGIHRADRVREA
jgi:hypothetical protein